MKSLESEQETVARICDILTEETLEPARAEAKRLVEAAEKEAHALKEQAYREKDALLKEAEEEIKQKETLFHSTMSQAAKQTLEALRQTIQKELFGQQLQELIGKEMQKPQIIAELIRSIVEAIDKDGLKLNLEALIPKVVSKEEVNKLLSADVLKKLENKSAVLSDIPGGVEVKVKDHQLTIDMSQEAVQEVVSSFIRKDLREMIFGSGEV